MFSPVGDCEVGAAKKACKNCTCGRAEAEEKVGKLELTAEQINNPQSACGSVSIAYRWHLCPPREISCSRIRSLGLGYLSRLVISVNDP